VEWRAEREDVDRRPEGDDGAGVVIPVRLVEAEARGGREGARGVVGGEEAEQQHENVDARLQQHVEHVSRIGDLVSKRRRPKGLGAREEGLEAEDQVSILEEAEVEQPEEAEPECSPPIHFRERATLQLELLEDVE